MKEIEQLKTLSMMDILTVLPDVQVDQEVRNDKLIMHLVRNGYINEDYHYYISHFYEGTITRTDLDFLLSVKDRQALPFDYKLENIALNSKVLDCGLRVNNMPGRG